MVENTNKHTIAQAIVNKCQIDVCKEIFAVIPDCANANVTSKIFGYAYTTGKTLLVLLQLSKQARGFVHKHWDGAI